ncbi:Acyl-coenzyme A:6-aminopenicillanic acid acyl-transferase [Anatilimnocola aggregata]|jgi:isopenicillin-N N-acyltransferase-like protein|uniref:Acyl-coenzyme A:6-aminopenicillanic acid acyl-transferase n=1 Tax=Anatilimnocola aggregata TaxID=2528021 RepID=A0A517YAC7_9BACT|nr:C45 family peptidase [Anatilimnocola aggregata]QDU27178.1 Acyl-coenzyme A:6-aminopenicillanic acid acyl-transferase [Anatilimnocola aggregata]
MSRYKEIEVAGLPRAMGRQIGEAAREEIRGFCAIALSLVNKSIHVSRAAADEIIASTLRSAELYSTDMAEELRGMAEGAGVPLSDLMLLQIRNQLQPDADAGCTSLSLPGQRENRSGRIVAQNWDNDPALQPFTLVLTRRPIGKPALMTVTQAGLIAYIGFNEAGIGVCLNTLPAPSRRFGVPHYFTVRGVYEADSLETALHAVQRADRAIPANIMLTTPQGPADLEVTLDCVHVLSNEGDAGITHTNHCRHPELQTINQQFPELIQSHERQSRVDQLLDFPVQHPGVKEVMSLLCDHVGFPRSICRHANDDPQTGSWETVFSVVIEPAARQMHISRGTPCNHPYEVYNLT